MWKVRVRRGPVIGVVVACVAIPAIILIPPSSGLHWGIAEHTACVTIGSPTSSLLWSPLAVVNSPFGGGASASAVVPGAASGTFSWTISASNGSASGLFELDQWTVTQVKTEMMIGPGSNSPCSSAWIASDVSLAQASTSGRILQTYILLPSGSVSDSSEPTHFTLAYSPMGGSPEMYPSVQFNNAFLSPTGPTYSACSSMLPPAIPSSEVGAIPVSVPTPGGGTAPGSVSVDDQLSYSFTQGSSGTWTLSPTQAGGLAFEWSPCPAT